MSSNLLASCTAAFGWPGARNTCTTSQQKMTIVAMAKNLIAFGIAMAKNVVCVRVLVKNFTKVTNNSCDVEMSRSRGPVQDDAAMP